MAIVILSIWFRRNLSDPLYWIVFAIPLISYFLYALVCKFDYAQGPRFMLPILYVQAVLLGVLFSTLRQGQMLRRWIIALVLAALLPHAVLSPRSLVWPTYLRRNHVDSMFHWAPELKKEMVEAARYALELHPAVVGIDAQFADPGLDPFEYLIVRLLTLESGFRSPVVQSFNVQNNSAALWGKTYRAPDCLILYNNREDAKRDLVTGKGYIQSRKWSHVQVMVPIAPLLN
jgi:hypothetical protein